MRRSRKLLMSHRKFRPRELKALLGCVLCAITPDSFRVVNAERAAFSERHNLLTCFFATTALEGRSYGVPRPQQAVVGSATCASEVEMRDGDRTLKSSGLSPLALRDEVWMRCTFITVWFSLAQVVSVLRHQRRTWRRLRSKISPLEVFYTTTVHGIKDENIPRP